MALTPEEKAARKRKRMIETARQYTLGTYKNKLVAPVFQRMVRAEAAAEPAGATPAVVDGELKQVPRVIGEVVCVTCGKVAAWSGGLAGMHTGHFLASRANAILFREDNTAPQCSHCNRYETGAPEKFQRWMAALRGELVIEQLEAAKRTARSFTRKELVDLRIAYQIRLDAAIKRMQNTGSRADTRLP